MTSNLEQTLLRITHAFPKGSIWQTRYLTFPFTLIASALALTHSTLPLLERALWWIAGLATWTLLEYILHRWVLHYSPTTTLGRAILERFHIRHHDDPADESEVCVPFVLSLPILIFLYSVLLIFGGGTQASLLFVSGVGLLATIYDLAHFSAHYMKPTNWVLKTLKKNHMLHHFSDHTQRFGVTSTFWDHVFGTRGNKAPTPDGH